MQKEGRTADKEKEGRKEEREGGRGEGKKDGKFAAITIVRM
jgi:hypothetical protein